MRNTVSLARQVKEFCSRKGMDSLLIQGAGGNVSWKEGGTLWIKASGMWLAEAQSREIFVPVDLNALRQSIVVGKFDSAARVIGDSTLRPSIETMLHALLPHRVVAHLHAVEVLSMLVRENSFEEAKSKLGQEANWLYVEYLKPGADLARGVYQGLLRCESADIILLENHGIVVGADSVQALEQRIDSVLSVMEQHQLNVFGGVDLGFLGPLEINARHYVVSLDDGVHCLARDDRLLARLSLDWALYPDHVVFLGPRAWIWRDECSQQFEQLPTEEMPPFIFVAGRGVIEKVGVTEATRLQLRCYRDVLLRQQPDTSLRNLAFSEVHALLEWDLEKYRKHLQS
jgi:rhamnose utilization protein RhaD (predicted bifunctional aldolase and dehydrogenase)